MIIVIGGIKGGTGKTTIATNLAVLNQMLGRKTLLIDTDDQRSASDWADQRENYFKNKKQNKSNFPTIFLSGKNIYQQIDKFKDNFDDIIIDTAGRDSISQRSSLVNADLYILPFRPKSFDLWTAEKVKIIITEIQSINTKLRVITCINQGDSSGKDNEESLNILREIPNFFCLDKFLKNRKVYSNSAGKGLGVWESRNQKAKLEILSLYREIYV